MVHLQVSGRSTNGMPSNLFPLPPYLLSLTRSLACHIARAHFAISMMNYNDSRRDARCPESISYTCCSVIQMSASLCTIELGTLRLRTFLSVSLSQLSSVKESIIAVLTHLLPTTIFLFDHCQTHCVSFRVYTGSRLSFFFSLSGKYSFIKAIQCEIERINATKHDTLYSIRFH